MSNVIETRIPVEQRNFEIPRFGQRSSLGQVVAETQVLTGSASLGHAIQRAAEALKQAAVAPVFFHFVCYSVPNSEIPLIRNQVTHLRDTCPATSQVDTLVFTSGSISLRKRVFTLGDALGIRHAATPSEGSFEKVEARHRELLQKRFTSELSGEEQAELERLREQLDEADEADPELQAVNSKAKRNYAELRRELSHLNSVLDRLLEE